MSLTVAVVGGLSPGLLERWLGDLPFFRDAAELGRLMPLDSTKVPYEAPALASAMTGASVGEHGVYSMWKVRSQSLANPPDVIDVRDTAAQFLWEAEDFGNRRVLLFNLIGSYPPQPVNGICVSYPFYPTTNISWPREALAQLSAAGAPTAHDLSVFFTPDTDRADFVRDVHRVEEARFAAFRYLAQQPFDLRILNITVIDRLSHFYWHEVEGQLEPRDIALWHAYVRVDAMLTELAETLADQDTLLVFGDVGFGPLKRFVAIDDTLSAAGFYQMGENNCPDPSRTVAFEAPQGSHGILISRETRFVDGIVADSDYERCRQEVIAALSEARDTETGALFFRNVVRTEEMYSGNRLKEAPDILVEPFDEAVQPRGHRFWANHVSRDLQSGWHRRRTTWTWAGRGSVRPNDTTEISDIRDLMAELIGCVPTKVRVAGRDA